MKSVGIRELRQSASQVIEAAAGGATFRVTNHGKETGVLIGREQPTPHDVAGELTGASPQQILDSGVYDSPKPAKYEEEMLRLVDDGRERSGRLGS